MFEHNMNKFEVKHQKYEHSVLKIFFDTSHPLKDINNQDLSQRYLFLFSSDTSLAEEVLSVEVSDYKGFCK